MTEGWTLEQDTRTRVDDHGFVLEEPTGFGTFDCVCGDHFHDRLPAVSDHARDHIASQHPAWPLTWWAPEGTAS